MEINYSDQKVIKGKKSIFLAGPTPRDKDIQSWRPKAIKMLEEMGYDGVVYIPEREYDDRSFDYVKQVWWEREALHNASAIVFWVPRNMKTMPALTTNDEFGTWVTENPDKVVYGRPKDAEKNRYLDWQYETESGKTPHETLEDTLEEAMMIAEERKGLVDEDSYEIGIINRTIKKYPEILTLIGDIEFTPEAYGTKSEKTTYGQTLFKDVNPEQLKEFDRTILSVLLYYYIKHDRYDKFVELQSGDNMLTKEDFEELREFMTDTFNIPEKEELLIYYMVINDLGKSKSVINMLKEKGIESIDHDQLLAYMVENNMLPSLEKFDDIYKKNLMNVLRYGFNVGQLTQGECVAYSLDNVLKLDKFERELMMGEAMLDIGGVLGHSNNRCGSAILNHSTVENLLTADYALYNSNDAVRIYNDFLEEKGFVMNIDNDYGTDVQRAITRICLLMRLWKPSDIDTVKKEIIDNLDYYRPLIDEYNKTGYDGEPGILLYYSPALLNNTKKYFDNNKSENSLQDTLKVCLPFLQNTFIGTRSQIGTPENGVLTVMLRDASIQATEDPTKLGEFGVNILNSGEATLQRRLK